MRKSARSSPAELPAMLRSLLRVDVDVSAPHLVIAAPVIDGKNLPPGVRLSRKRLRGKRIAVKGPRLYSNTSMYTASWPDDGLIETRRAVRLVFVAGGHTDFQAGDNIIHCGTGTFILCPAGMPHPDGSAPHLDESRQKSDIEHCDLIWFMPWQSGIRCWTCCSRGNRHFYAEDNQATYIPDAQCYQLLELLDDEGGRGLPGSLRISRGLLMALLANLQRELDAGRFYAERPSFHLGEGLGKEDIAEPVKLAQKYIASHLSEHLTLENVAARVHLSRSQFAQQFHHEVGQSFVEFMTDLRLERAKQLLCETDWSQMSVSRHIGLSHSYFCKLFLRREGMTPSSYRRQATVTGNGEG